MTELTTALAAKIEGLVRAGATPAGAAEACGMARETFDAWMRDAENEPGPTRDLRDRIIAAEAEARTATEIELRKKSPRAWLLQNRKPTVAPAPGLTLAGQPRKNNSGRKIKEIDLAKVERLASQGLNFDQIAEDLDIAINTFYRRKRQFREFSHALKRGRAQFRDTLSRRFVDLVREGNVAAVIYATKVHLGWRENEPMVEINNHQNVRVAPDPATLVADANLIREAILIFKRLGAPDAQELEEADFKALPETKRGQG